MRYYVTNLTEETSTALQLTAFEKGFTWEIRHDNQTPRNVHQQTLVFYDYREADRHAMHIYYSINDAAEASENDTITSFDGMMEVIRGMSKDRIRAYLILGREFISHQNGITESMINLLDAFFQVNNGFVTQEKGNG